MTIPGVGLRSSTKVPIDIFVERVAILQDTVLAVQRADSFYDEAVKQLKTKSEGSEQAHHLYRAILGLLQRSGHLRFKPPRDFADD